MTHGDVTSDQAREVAARIVPALVYFGGLHERMRRRGFPADDPLMVNVTLALEAMRQLRAALHEVEAPRPTPAFAGAAQIVPEAEAVPQWRRAMGANAA